MMDLAELACSSLDWIRGQDPGVEAELYLARGEERGIELREGRLDHIQHAASEGAGLRVLAGGRMGFAWSSSWPARALLGRTSRAWGATRAKTTSSWPSP